MPRLRRNAPVDFPVNRTLGRCDAGQKSEADEPRSSDIANRHDEQSCRLCRFYRRNKAGELSNQFRSHIESDLCFPDCPARWTCACIDLCTNPQCCLISKSWFALQAGVGSQNDPGLVAPGENRCRLYQHNHHRRRQLPLEHFGRRDSPTPVPAAGL